MKPKITSCLLLLAAVQLSVCVQAQKRDTLLTFIGHWQSKTVFKADSNYVTHTAVGGNVTVGKDGSVTVQSQGGQHLNQQIDQGMSQVDQLESQVKQELVNSEGLNEYHLYQFSQGAIDSAKAFYFGLKIDGPPPGGTSTNPTYQQYNQMANWCIGQENNYNSIVGFYQAHKKDKHYDYPPPPLADYFNCWGCNRDAQRAFEKQLKGYDTTFFEPELGLLKNTISLLRNLTILGQAGDDAVLTGDMQRMVASLFKYSKQHPENNGPCEFLDAGKLAQAEAFLAQRLVDKADQFARDVKQQNNYNATIPAVREYLRAEDILERTLGTDRFSNGNESTCFEACRAIVEKLLTKLTDKIMSEHDISYLSDLPFMLSLAAQDQLLGGSGDGYPELLDQMTHYTLSLDLSVKTNLQGGVTQTAHLKGKADMVVELDTVACVRLVLAKAENSIFTAKVLENSMTTPKCTPSYTGTTTYTMPAPLLILHFCNKGGADSLTLGKFQPQPASAGLWKVPCGMTPPMNMGINGLDGYFIDPKNVMKNAMNIKANASAYQGQLQQMMAQAQQMQSQIQSQMANGGANSSGPASGMKSVLDMSNNTAPVDLMNAGRLEVPITLNNATLIINQTIDAKQTNTYGQMTQLLEYGLYKVQLIPKTNAQ